MRTIMMAPVAKILVVDDDVVTANSTVAMLQRNRYHAVAAFDGEGAIHTARHFLPDAIIIDISPPDMSRTELMLLMVEMLPDCGILLVTRQQGPRPLVSSARVRGLEFRLVAKPIVPEELLRALTAVLSSAKKQAQAA